MINLTVTNGTGSWGGCFRAVSSASLTLKGVDLVNCAAAERGGSIYAFSNATVVVEASTIRASSAEIGGAMFVEDAKLTLKDVDVVNCTANRGGAIDAMDKAIIVVEASSIRNSSAENAGGAIYAQSATHLAVIGSKISASSARYGGGIAGVRKRDIANRGLDHRARVSCQP